MGNDGGRLEAFRGREAERLPQGSFGDLEARLIAPVVRRDLARCVPEKDVLNGVLDACDAEKVFHPVSKRVCRHLAVGRDSSDVLAERRRDGSATTFTAVVGE